MVKFVLSVSLAFLSFAAVPTAQWDLLLEGIEHKVLPVELQGAKDDEPYVCSGVVINATAGVLLSAAHCMEDPTINVVVAGRHAEVARLNRVLDLAVVRFTSGPEHTAVPLAKVTPKMGQAVAVVGYPALMGATLHSQFGHVAGFVGYDRRLVVDGMTLPGDSGGALINSAGELVGINVAVRYELDGVSHLGLAVSLDTIRDFVQPYLPKE